MLRLFQFLNGNGTKIAYFSYEITP